MKKKDIVLIILVLAFMLLLSGYSFFLKIKKYLNEKEAQDNICVGEFINNDDKYILTDNNTFTFISNDKTIEGNYEIKKNKLTLKYKSESYTLTKDNKCSYIEKDNIKYYKNK